MGAGRLLGLAFFFLVYVIVKIKFPVSFCVYCSFFAILIFFNYPRLAIRPFFGSMSQGSLVSSDWCLLYSSQAC